MGTGEPLPNRGPEMGKSNRPTDATGVFSRAIPARDRPIRRPGGLGRRGGAFWLAGLLTPFARAEARVRTTWGEADAEPTAENGPPRAARRRRLSITPVLGHQRTHAHDAKLMNRRENTERSGMRAHYRSSRGLLRIWSPGSPALRFVRINQAPASYPSSAYTSTL